MTIVETGSLRSEVESVGMLCRQAVESGAARLAGILDRAPQSPSDWFELLRGIPERHAHRARLAGLCREAELLGLCQPGEVERFSVLMASLAALPRLEADKGHDCLAWQFCAMLRRIATRPGGWGDRFHHDGDAFHELAKIMTFRRWHAGQSSFDIMDLPRAWFLKVHPLALPGLITEVVRELRGLEPIVMPHINYWRLNASALVPKENEMASWRIAQFVGSHPEIRGLVAASWLFTSEMPEFSPHLAWLRQFYVDAGAYLVDMEIAHEGAGYLVGSETRRRLYREGKLKPRETLVIWPRAQILQWAAQFDPEAGQRRAGSAVENTSRHRPEPKWQSRTNDIFSSGQWTLVSLKLFLRSNPRPYILRVFGIPLALLAMLVLLSIGLWAVVPALITGFVAIWLFQYFFLQ